MRHMRPTEHCTALISNRATGTQSINQFITITAASLITHLLRTCQTMDMFLINHAVSGQDDTIYIACFIICNHITKPAVI